MAAESFRVAVATSQSQDWLEGYNLRKSQGTLVPIGVYNPRDIDSPPYTEGDNDTECDICEGPPV